MPMIVKANKTYGDKVTFIAVSLDDNTTAKYIKDFISTTSMKMPVWVGATGDDMEKLGVGPAVPSTLFIDKDGGVVSRIVGQLHKKDIETRLDWMLSDRSAPAPEAMEDHVKPVKKK
jgi:hypothetical protein